MDTVVSTTIIYKKLPFPLRVVIQVRRHQQPSFSVEICLKNINDIVAGWYLPLFLMISPHSSLIYVLPTAKGIR